MKVEKLVCDLCGKEGKYPDVSLPYWQGGGLECRGTCLDLCQECAEKAVKLENTNASLPLNRTLRFRKTTIKGQ